MRNFRELEVWQLGMDLATRIYPLTESWPQVHLFRLTTQIIGSSSAIPSNIAEGYSRSINKDFKRYLEYALGEAFETETQLLLACSYKLIAKEQLDEIVEDLHVLQRKINAFIQVIK